MSGLDVAPAHHNRKLYLNFISATDLSRRKSGNNKTPLVISIIPYSSIVEDSPSTAVPDAAIDVNPTADAPTIVWFL